MAQCIETDAAFLISPSSIYRQEGATRGDLQSFVHAHVREDIYCMRIVCTRACIVHLGCERRSSHVNLYTRG